MTKEGKERLRGVLVAVSTLKAGWSGFQSLSQQVLLTSAQPRLERNIPGDPPLSSDGGMAGDFYLMYCSVFPYSLFYNPNVARVTKKRS